MSKTDKTRPYWVQLRDPLFPYGLSATHFCHNELRRRHYGSECDLDFPLPVTRRAEHGCSLWPRYRDNDKIYGRSRWRRNYPSMDGRARASLRKLRADWLKTAPEDREDIDSRTDVPRSKWLWRSWYWD